MRGSWGACGSLGSGPWLVSRAYGPEVLPISSILLTDWGHLKHPWLGQAVVVSLHPVVRDQG